MKNFFLEVLDKMDYFIQKKLKQQFYVFINCIVNHLQILHNY